MIHLKPWVLTPFELLEHAEMHLKNNSDFDKRMALVSFDNSIESTISTYLTLNPAQRNGQQFQKSDVEKWLNNYHTKIEFIEHFVLHILKQRMEVEREDIIFYHELRNELYHKGNGFVPAEIHVQGIRKAAIWIFSTLFRVQNVDELLLEKIKDPIFSTQYATSSLSPEIAFLEIFNNFRREFNDLLETNRKISNDELKLSVAEVLHGIAKNTEISPNQAIDLLEKAGEISNTIVQGKSLEETPAELENITNQLEQLSEKIESGLRDYQKQIVESAIQATINAIENEKTKIGTILQSVGTGLGISLLSFVLRTRTNSALKHLPVLVLSDRREIREQLYHTLRKTLGDQTELATIANDRTSLINLLSLEQPKIIFTTAQLARIDREVLTANRECLVVGYDIQASIEFERLIPKGFFIYFASTLSIKKEIAGDVIAKYNFDQAIQDGFALSIKIEKRFPNNKSGFLKGQTTREELAFLAQDILKHFQLRQSQYSGKGLIIVPDIEFGNKLRGEFLAIKSNQFSIEIINSRMSSMIRSVLYERFTDENDNLSLVITTGSWLMGTDNPLLNVAYLASTVSEQFLLQLVSRINRPHKNKEDALLVDYVDIDWKKIRNIVDNIL